jgi:hypothetical protein
MQDLYGDPPMPMITHRREALREIRRCGYLNFFQGADSWFRTHSVPGGEAMDCRVIEFGLADKLISDGLVRLAGERVDLTGTLVRWYELAPQEARRQAP